VRWMFVALQNPVSPVRASFLMFSIARLPGADKQLSVSLFLRGDEGKTLAVSEQQGQE
jgi:hypothetical protein